MKKIVCRSKKSASVFEKREGNQDGVFSSSDDEGIYAIAAKGESGSYLLLSSVKDSETPVEIVRDKPIRTVRTVTKTGLKKASFEGVLPKESVLLISFEE